MSNFARFVRPGFFRIDATENPQPDVFITAFKGGSKIVIVVVNNGSLLIKQKFVLQNGTAAKFASYVTSGTKNCNRERDIAVSNGSFTVTLDGSSITTFVSD